MKLARYGSGWRTTRAVDRWTLLSPLLVLPAAIVVVTVGGLHAGFVSLALDPKQAAFWDILLKGVAGAIALAGALLAAQKFLSEQAAANEAALIEAIKPFAERRQAVYFELVSATALLGTLDDQKGDAWDAAKRKFWELYWGAVPMVADLDVGGAVNRFSAALDHPENRQHLRNCSMDLARACRNSLGFVQVDAPPPGL